MHGVDRLLHARYQFHVYLLFLYRMGHVMCRVELKLTVARLHLTTMSITVRPARVRIPLPVSTETTIH
jgi:hypothetical protein